MIEIRVGDCRELLRAMPDASVHCCVTSPPYFGLRDYGVDGQIGLEQTPEAFVAELVAVFRDVRRVLRDDGTCWLNLGDSYAAQGGAHGGRDDNQRGVGAKRLHIEGAGDQEARRPAKGYKPKDLLGIPWMVAFALRADGWYLRQDIIWAKPNPMPESVRDRCTKAHEYVFLLSKSERYFYDADAVSEAAEQAGRVRSDRMGGNKYGEGVKHSDGSIFFGSDRRNRRSVWSITTQPFSGAHFATMPPELAETCIKAGCPSGGMVLDPFGGAGTTGLVADRLSRHAILLELNPQYAQIARDRIRDDAPLFAEVA